MNKIDLFEKLVRFLAIKPFNENEFCLEEAEVVIKEENKNDITFIGQHGYFEDVLDTVGQRIANLKLNTGSLYIYIKGDNSKKRIERNLLKIILNVDHIYIIGEAKDWKISDPKIDFLKIENIFPDNHQRFIIFRSPSYNVAMTARKTKCKKNGKDRIEGALTNKKDAVSFLAQILGTKIYSQKQ